MFYKVVCIFIILFISISIYCVMKNHVTYLIVHSLVYNCHKQIIACNYDYLLYNFVMQLRSLIVLRLFIDFPAFK